MQAPVHEWPSAALLLRFRSSRTDFVRSGAGLAVPCIWPSLNRLNESLKEREAE